MQVFKRIVYLIFIGSFIFLIIFAFLPKPVIVEAVAVTRGKLQVTINEDGKTRIKERYIVSAPVAGKQQRIQLNIGDSVIAGKTLLTTIEPSESPLLDERTQTEKVARVKAAQSNCKQCEAQLNRISGELQLAKSERERAQKLFKSQLFSRQDLDKAITTEHTLQQEHKRIEFAQEIARFELEMAKAALEVPEESKSKPRTLNIVSPVTGKILDIFEKNAIVVAPGTKILEIGNMKNLEIISDVLSSDAVKIRPGNAVVIEHWGGKPIRGVVKYVEPSAFTKVSALGVEEQRVNVVINFSAPHGLGDNYRVETRIVIWQNKNVLKIPINTLFRVKDKWAVFVINDNTAQMKIVTIDHWGEFFVEVKSGVKEGELVIVHPGDQIENDVEVVVQGK
ncbi:efflux RND transporter periplasmic adaptor subunit [Candidatus Uabimicrobium amorphum]|uniref:Membrane protein n=1 Tax=Uabimicrobium amorphum TaxID=2596890 RepID=A0A5S9INN6_UABAM|nr:HlyD family efflux transporter periplasmic adaptor subunit [Candidatus Uabimicrobium amorphum]BBM85219.1 membrane protein [Candidatus Uabimicrobium amorphum]